MHKEEEWTRIFRENWYFLAAFILCIGGLGYKVMTAPMETLPKNQATTTLSVTTSKDILRQMNQITRQQTSRDKTLKIIQRYKDFARKNPDDTTKTPAYLSAMGNLYRDKLLDFETAAQVYEQVLSQYPDWPAIRQVYISLADCYERLHRPREANRVYRLMMEKFPEDSQEYEYAKTVLEGKAIPPQRHKDPPGSQ